MTVKGLFQNAPGQSSASGKVSPNYRYICRHPITIWAASNSCISYWRTRLASIGEHCPADENNKLNLGKIISRSALYWPDHEALVDNKQRINFAQLELRTNRLASGLFELGLQSGAHLAILALNRVELVEAEIREHELAEARVEAERMLEATRTALAADGDLLSPEQRAELDRLMTQIGQRCDRGDLEALEAATKALAQGTEAFAAERMNRSIRQALAGRQLDQL